MRRRKINEIGDLSIGLHIRNIADIPMLSKIPNTALTIVNVQKFKMFNIE